MPDDIHVLAAGDCIEADKLNENFSALLAMIQDLQVNPPAPSTPPGAVLDDGSVPMLGCLTLPDSGCTGDEHAVRWSDLRALLDGPTPFAGAVKRASGTGSAEVAGGEHSGVTNGSGLITVPLSGFASTPDAVVVTMTSGHYHPRVSAVNAGSFVVELTNIQTPAVLAAGATVSFHWYAYRD
jgi:hypothetical protein